MKTILEHVGSRIRLYRKASGMTTDELAKKVHKSKGTISKYETGQIAVDIVTLFEIACALDVSPIQILDYLPPKPIDQERNTMLDQTDRLYMYHLRIKNIYASVITLGGIGNSAQTATLFYKVEDVKTKERCGCIYYGHMYNHATAINFVFDNYHNPMEKTLLSCVFPMQKTKIFIGMLSGLGVATLIPTSHKVVLSLTPQDDSEELRNILTIKPDTFKEMKRKNTLFIPLSEDL